MNNTITYDTAIDISKINSLEFEGIDHKDYPDYCDAYISAGKIDDRDLTDDEIDLLNSNSEYADFKYSELMDFIH